MKKILFRILLVLLSLIVVFFLIIFISFSIANKTNGSIQSSGETRKYLLYVPETYNPESPTPLVISIHGFAEWPAHQMKISHWNELADEFGFIVVYPAGTGFPLRWNANPQNDSEVEFQKDLQFFTDLMDRLEKEFTIDPKRIYVNGLSNGGGMSFTLSCNFSEKIAAMGGVAGAYLLSLEQCNPDRPFPMIVFHGTADPIVPYEGGPSRSFDIPFPNIPQWVFTMAKKNGCDLNPQNLPTSGEVSGIRYDNCNQNAEVIFYTISGGGHSWPGGDALPEFIAGYTSDDINATRVIWDFFSAHPLMP